MRRRRTGDGSDRAGGWLIHAKYRGERGGGTIVQARAVVKECWAPRLTTTAVSGVAEHLNAPGSSIGPGDPDVTHEAT